MFGPSRSSKTICFEILSYLSSTIVCIYRPRCKSLVYIYKVFFYQVPGPCDPEDLVDGVLFAANYLGSTQLLVDKNSTKTARMMQAQEAMTRVKAMVIFFKIVLSSNFSMFKKL